MAPTAQKPLVGQFDWPAVNPPPHNSSRPLHHSHSHYESPFQQVDMRPPGAVQSTANFFSQQLAALSAYLSRQPVVLTVFLVACAVAIVALALFLCGAKSRLERQQRLYECRRHFADDDDDDEKGFTACEKAHGPAQGESLRPETRHEFGLNAGSTHAQGAQGAVTVAASNPACRRFTFPLTRHERIVSTSATLRQGLAP